MFRTPSIRSIVVAVALAAAGLSSSMAQELVSVRSATVNLRGEPNLQGEVLWKLTRGYPLQVLERQGDWLRVQDFEGDQGWIASSVTQTTPHHIVKARSLNLRAGPGTEHPVVDRAQYGDVLTTVRRAGDWVEVKLPRGEGSAWAASELLWGW